MLRSDDNPDVQIFIGASGEACNIAKLDQHIRTLLTARRWMKKERELRGAPKERK
jgi:hypothetical protein